MRHATAAGILGLALAVLVASALVQPALAAEPTPQPTTTLHADRPCDRFTVSAPAVVGFGTEASVTVTRMGDRPSVYALRRLVPEPVATVRQTEETAEVTWSLRLGESHLLRVVADHPDGGGCFNYTEVEVERQILVQPLVTIDATRHGVRDYTFHGRVGPSRGQSVSLFYIDAGRRVLAARTVVQPDGTYVIHRRFTGTGRFGFTAEVAQSQAHTAGYSRMRSTLIH